MATETCQNQQMDPRAVRTRKQLQDALMALTRERTYDDITIADIAEHAGLSRSVVYLHYADKGALLGDALDVAAEATRDILSEDMDFADPPTALTGYLTHLNEHAALYRQVLGESGPASAVARIRERLEQIVAQGLTLARKGAFGGLPSGVVAAGLTGAGLGVIAYWLEQDPRPEPAVAAAWTWALLGQELAPAIAPPRREE